MKIIAETEQKCFVYTLGGDEHEYLLGEHACQTPCRELLIPLRGQGRGTRVDWTLLNFVSTSADEDTNQLVLIVVHLQKMMPKMKRIHCQLR